MTDSCRSRRPEGVGYKCELPAGHEGPCKALTGTDRVVCWEVDR